MFMLCYIYIKERNTNSYHIKEGSWYQGGQGGFWGSWQMGERAKRKLCTMVLFHFQNA